MASRSQNKMIEMQRLVQNEEDFKICDSEGCTNEALYKCSVRILCRKYGCQKELCEDCRSHDKFCQCLDQRPLVCC